MFGHKCFLRIGELSDGSPAGLYKESYELLSCSFGFGQGTDANGKPQSEVFGGVINIVYPNVPPKEFINWMIKANMHVNGLIVICDANDMPLEKIYFENATCTNMEINYIQNGNSYVTTNMTLVMQKIAVGNTAIENKWVNVKE